MDKPLHIKEPFYTAGRQYAWPGKAIGIGISVAHLLGDGLLRVVVGPSPKVWVIEKEKARVFVKQYKSVFHAKGTRLGIIAWHEFREEREPNGQMELL